MDWPTGMKAAAKAPWMKRRTTISISEVDWATRMVVAANPTTEISSSRLRPMRAATAPVSGVIMTAATM